MLFIAPDISLSAWQQGGKTAKTFVACLSWKDKKETLIKKAVSFHHSTVAVGIII